jgi:hypothetical protein
MTLAEKLSAAEANKIDDPSTRREVIEKAFDGVVARYLTGEARYDETDAWFKVRRAVSPISQLEIRAAFNRLEPASTRTAQSMAWKVLQLFRKEVLQEPEQSISVYIQRAFQLAGPKIDYDSALIWAGLVRDALRLHRKSGVATAAASFDLARSVPASPVSRVVVEAFPAIYERLPAKAKRNFFSFFLDDFDSRKAARRSLVDLFLQSKWEAADLAIVAFRIKALPNVIGRLRFLEQTTYIGKMKRGLQEQGQHSIAKAVGSLMSKSLDPD